MRRPFPSAVPIVLASLGLFLLLAWRQPAPPEPPASPFTVGTNWTSPEGLQCTIEEVRGEWLRVSTSTVLGGFEPKAIWIYAPTGLLWRENRK